MTFPSQKITTVKEAKSLIGKRYTARSTDNTFDVMHHFFQMYDAIVEVETVSSTPPIWIVKAARPATESDRDQMYTINGGVPKV